MAPSTRMRRNSYWHVVALLMLLGIAGLMSSTAVAQQATAAINGVVKDQTGAAIPNARVDLTNVNTAVVRTTSTNNDGVYAFPSVVPGAYTLQASAPGFMTVKQEETTLQVSQTATFDFQLKIGTTQQNVTVNASEGAALETSTSELGTVVSTQEVTDLPLNGRNFTQLLTITAGVANINRDQSAGGGGGWAGHSLGSFTFPAVNGARNRSNYFMLDGQNDLNTMLGMYNYSPIVDAIQEFKTQGHNDLAEYGGVAGGIVSVVTKSGTNQFHGALWEFLRNQAMDARGYFESTLPPLRQNQYGGSVGGPVWIPKLYDGKNKTFFYAAWEGYRFSSASETGALGPTDAERNGDFSALSAPIYDPATTTLVDGTYSRQTFTQEYNEGPANTALCGGHVNCIPTDRINPISALYQTLIPNAGPLVNGNNIYSSGPQHTSQDTGTARGDQNFGNNNQLMFRYSQFDQQVANTTDIVGLNTIHVYGHNYIGHWTHTFTPTAFSDVYFGRNFGDTITGQGFPGETPAFLSQLQTLGMSKFWMILNNTEYAPQWGADGYLGLSGSQLQETGLANNWQWGGSFSKILGKHTIKAGADFQTNNFRSPIAYSGASFGTAQTAGLGAQQGVGGNAWASLLLGVPREASYRNILEVDTGGYTNGVYVQDQIKATSHLTVNIGFRNDLVWQPIYGTGKGGNFYTGNANPITGQYELNTLPPNCSATQGAPCIPTGIYTASSTPAPGGLPANAYVNPSSDHRVIKNSLFDWAGRFGLDYRIGNKMVARASYTRFYDAWATVVQLAQNFGGNWPAVNTIDNAGLNINVPTAPANDPLGFGNGGALIYPINDFSQVSQWMVDPNFRTPYMDQWNLGIERQLPENAVLDANYVGSVGRHLDWGPTLNVPSPGPGDVQARRPYPYMLQQWFDQSVGNSRYNAMQITLNKRTSHGVTFLVAYTLSHSNDDGCGLGANCNSSNPYNKKVDYGTSDTNQTHAFSAAFTLQSPFVRSSNKLVSIVAGGWALNGIGQLSSGLPYTVTNSGDPENIGCCQQQRVNVTGDPNKGSGLHTPAEWFNVNAFAVQSPYTYGNEKVNPYVSESNRNLDLSLFRTFHLGLGESRYFEFRAESFNLFNRVMFDVPNSSLGGTNFGAVTSQRNSPRQLQMGLKFNY
jgi:Carboxypeptidase regulatory-like domain